MYMRNTLEYLFNPEQAKKNGSIFETRCYFPKTGKEKTKGALYLIAESQNQNDSFLMKKFFKIIQEEFYSNSFQQALDKANEFISQNGLIASHLAALAFSYPYKVKISKTGKIKVLLLRKDDAFDMAAELDNQGLLKFIEGDLQKNDKIIFLTNNVFNIFLKYKVLSKIGPLKNKKQVKRFFKENKPFFQKICGALIITFVKKAPWPWFAKKPKPPLPPASKTEKAVIAAILFVILLLLGYLLF